MPLTKPWSGYWELTLSMLFFAITLVLGKTLLALFPIFLLLAIRFLMGTSFFSLTYYLHAAKNGKAIEKLSHKDIGLIFLQAFFGAFCFNLFMLLGLRETSANTAAIITSTIPAFITAFSFFILKESLSMLKLSAITLSVLGVMLVTVTQIIQFDGLSLLGDLFILLAVVSGALFPICAKLVLTRMPVSFTSLTFNAFGLLLFLPWAINEAVAFNFYSITFSAWITVIFYSVAANILYLHFWNKGLTVVSASTASLFTAIMPMSTAIFAYLFLKEIMTTSQMVGMICILGAIFLGTKAEKIQSVFLLKARYE